MNVIKNQNFSVCLLLSFIFCGAIVGETVSISLAVAALGSSVISKLYLINGILLYGLPILFFKQIDKVDRGKLLSKILVVISAVLILVPVGMLLITTPHIPFRRYLLFLLYPFSYMVKTILFLTFWTMANDIFPTNEAKRKFPAIAAWGLAGGLIGAYSARVLVRIYPSEAIICLWAVAYIVAWYFSERVRKQYKDRLRLREELPTLNHHMFFEAGEILTLKLVRLIAILYFFVFLIIFLIDFLFWKVCHHWFLSSESLASFQFSFYLIYACATIGGLWLVLPPVIKKIGFTKLFYCFPIAVFIGSSILLIMYFGRNAQTFFTCFLIVQFFRYLIFENTFSPIYQMFFAAIEREKRGRAKTLLDGIVKPASMLTSGLLIMAVENSSILIFSLIIASSAVSIVVVYYIRRCYSLSLIPETVKAIEPKEIIADVAGFEGKRLQEIIRNYSESDESDMRMVSVKILSGIGTHQAFGEIRKIYEREENVKIKEFIAKSISDFYTYESRDFVERLLEDSNHRIRANVLSTLNKMNCNWKRHLRDKVNHLLFDGNLRVQIEAAKYLWENGEQKDKDTIQVFINSLLNAQSTNRRAAAMFLVGTIKPKQWEQILLKSLDSSSMQVFSRCTEMVFGIGSEELVKHALEKIDKKSREHIAIAGQVIEKKGIRLWDPIVEFIPELHNRRMIFEVVRCLRIMVDKIPFSERMFSLNKKSAEVISKWVVSELEQVYKDAYVRSYLLDGPCLEVLDQSLRENNIRICEWAVNSIVILDRSGMLVWRHTAIDIRENVQRMDLIEILESTTNQKISSLVLPLLKDENWISIRKTGKSNFKFEDDLELEDIDYFLKSDNRFVVLCAMYTMIYYKKNYKENRSIIEMLKSLSSDSNKYVSTAARDLLENDTIDERKQSEAFILLEKVLFFKKTPLFRKVSAEKLMRLAEISQYAVYEKGTVISVQGDVSDHLYIVKKGSLDVIKADVGASTVISLIEEGQTYGEIGLFSQSPRSASAIARDFCELYVIKRSAFKKLLMDVPEITYNLLETMSERLRKSGDDMLELKKRTDEDYFTQNSI